YDVLDDVSRQDSWEAYEYSLDDAISQGMFSTGFGDPTTGYKSIGWLSAQTYSGQSEEIGLQYAIWSVFGDNAHFQYLLANLTTAEQDAYNDFKGDLHNAISAIPFSLNRRPAPRAQAEPSRPWSLQSRRAVAIRPALRNRERW